MSTANLMKNAVVPAGPRRSALLASGAVAVAMGVVGLALVPLLTVATVLTIGVALVGAAVYQVTRAWRAPGGQPRTPHLVYAAVYAFGGLAMVFNPLGSAVGITLFAAFGLVLWGLHRVFGDAAGRDVGRGTVALIGGTLVMLAWPTSGIWAIGVAVAAAMLAIGWRNLVGGLRPRRPHDPEAEPGESAYVA